MCTGETRRFILNYRFPPNDQFYIVNIGSQEILHESIYFKLCSFCISITIPLSKVCMYGSKDKEDNVSSFICELRSLSRQTFVHSLSFNFHINFTVLLTLTGICPFYNSEYS